MEAEEVEEEEDDDEDDDEGRRGGEEEVRPEEVMFKTFGIVEGGSWSKFVLMGGGAEFCEEEE